MMEMFDEVKVYDIDVVAIQEPWRSQAQTSDHRLKDRFDIVSLPQRY